ncbi:hypothetical protein [Desulfitibacter alkalitolerans]|uniref:hypothetical protein n=1 Tax=Desulfitibacter alkalitolerans TaxID=264641 RepID=UPI0006865670|nr:hypothetical protein [Desulfitibacter alkalitolerans]
MTDTKKKLNMKTLFKYFALITLAVLFIFNIFSSPGGLKDESKIYDLLPGSDSYELLSSSPVIYAGYDSTTGDLKDMRL